MNIFQSELAFILCLSALLLSFFFNFLQFCYKSQNHYENAPTEDNLFEAPQTSEPSTPVLVPQLMQTTSFTENFPERTKYEKQFSSLRRGEGQFHFRIITNNINILRKNFLIQFKIINDFFFNCFYLIFRIFSI